MPWFKTRLDMWSETELNNSQNGSIVYEREKKIKMKFLFHNNLTILQISDVQV